MQEALWQNPQLDLSDNTTLQLAILEQIQMIHDEFNDKVLYDEDLPNYIEELKNQDFFIQYHGLVALNIILGSDKDPPIALAIQYCAVPNLLRIIKQNDTPYHVYEACKSLTYIICAGTYKQVKFAIGWEVIKTLVKLVKSDICVIAYQATWALGNLATKNIKFRDEILEYNGHIKILKFAENCIDIETHLNICVWALSKLCRGSPSPDFDLIIEVISFFAKVIEFLSHPTAIEECLLALTKLTKNEDGQRIVCNMYTLRRLRELLSDEELRIVVPALKILGNVAKGSEHSTMLIINTGILYKIPQLLRHYNKKVRKEVCRLISNIARDAKIQGKFILRNKEIRDPLFRIALNDCQEVRIQAFTAFAHLAIYLDDYEFLQVFGEGVLFRVCQSNISPISDSQLFWTCLNAIDQLIRNIPETGYDTFKNKIIKLKEQFLDNQARYREEVHRRF